MKAAFTIVLITTGTDNIRQKRTAHPGTILCNNPDGFSFVGNLFKKLRVDMLFQKCNGLLLPALTKYFDKWKKKPVQLMDYVVALHQINMQGLHGSRALVNVST